MDWPAEGSSSLGWLRSLNQMLKLLHHRVCTGMGRKLRFRDNALVAESQEAVANVLQDELVSADDELERIRREIGISDDLEPVAVSHAGPSQSDFQGVKFLVMAKVDCTADIFKLLDLQLQKDLPKGRQKLPNIIRRKSKATVSYWFSNKAVINGLFVRAGVKSDSSFRFTCKKGRSFEGVVDKHHKCLLHYTESATTPACYLKMHIFAQQL